MSPSVILRNWGRNWRPSRDGEKWYECPPGSTPDAQCHIGVPEQLKYLCGICFILWQLLIACRAESFCNRALSQSNRDISMASHHSKIFYEGSRWKLCHGPFWRRLSWFGGGSSEIHYSSSHNTSQMPIKIKFVFGVYSHASGGGGVSLFRGGPIKERPYPY
jgi:hypothetical protein